MSALFRSTSTAAFDKLYGRHAAAVYRYSRAVLGNHADAEDVTQQTFLNAYRALAQGTKPRKAENWLFTIAHNEVRRHMRNSYPKRLEVELDENLAQPARESSEPRVTDILRALQHLPANQRSALVMREFEGRSYAEIAEVMGVSQSALETLIFRARRTLAEALEDGLTCSDAELAVSRRLDGRLSRRDARRLKAHMRECRLCTGFEGRQKRQRSLLKGLSVIPVPASLFLFRGEPAAAAAGMTVGAAATGGSAGLVAKAAAVAAAVTVAGGVGYSAGAGPQPAGKAEQRITQPAVEQAESRKPRVVQPVRSIRVGGAPPGAAATPPGAAAGASGPGRSSQGDRVDAVTPKKVKVKAKRTGETRKSAKAAADPSQGAQAVRSAKVDRVKARPAPKKAKALPKARSHAGPLDRTGGPRRTPAKRERPAKTEDRAVPSPAVPPVREKESPSSPVPPVQDKQLLDPEPKKAKL